MTAISPETLVAIAVPCLGVVVWLLRLEGQVMTQKEIVKGIRDDLKYVRDRIDRALNGD